MELKKLNNKTLNKEIIMIALTYRLSPKNLAKLLNTTEEDVLEVIYADKEYNYILRNLINETFIEDENISKWSYYHAKQYFNKRNALIKEINALAKTGNKEVLLKKKEELKEHQRLIDDSDIKDLLYQNRDKIKTIDPISYTDEEKDMICKFKLKYSLSTNRVAAMFNLERVRVNVYVKDFVERYPMYENKFEYLNDIYESIKPGKYSNR